MAKPYTVRLAAVVVPGGTDTTIYTGFMGVTTIIRDISLTAISSTTTKAAIYLETPGGNVNLWVVTLDADLSAHWKGRQVVQGQDRIRVYVPDADTAVVITGYELEAD